jgi:hypothetical protein
MFARLGVEPRLHHIALLNGQGSDVGRRFGNRLVASVIRVVSNPIVPADVIWQWTSGLAWRA